MEVFKRYPFLRFCILFLVGILIGFDQIDSSRFDMFYLISILGILIFATSLVRNKSFQSFLIIISVVFLGLVTQIFLSLRPPNTKPGQGISFLKVDSWIKRSEKGMSFIAVDSLQNQVSVYIKDTCSDLKYGDVFVSRSIPELIQEPKNPSSFNFAKYWSRKGVYYSLFLNDSVIVVDNQPSNRLINEAFLLRLKISEEIDRRFAKSERKGIAKALLIGIKSEIDKNDLDSFRKAGVTHIISISGLHVGILLGFFMVIGNCVSSIQIKRFAVYPIILIFLWYYAFVAGLSTSIVRATIMCSVFILGKISSRKSDGLNTLLITSFIILFLNPGQLYDVGFQLSFMAVLGIMIFYKPIVITLSKNSKIIRFIASTMVITFSAQITTIPILVYHFNSISIISLASNLVLVPFSTFMVGTGFLFSLSGIFQSDLLSSLTTVIFEFTINIFSKISDLFASVPFSNLSNLIISPSEVFIYFALITTIYFILFSNRQLVRNRALICSLFLIVIHFGLSIILD